MGFMTIKNACSIFIVFCLSILILTPQYSSAEGPNTVPVSDFILKYIDNSNADKGWKETEHNEGISNYTKEIKGSDLNAYMGICVVDSSLETIYSVLSNVPEHIKWITFCSTASYLEKQSINDSYQYYDFNVPWPFLNRDMVVHCTTKIDWQMGKIVINTEAVKDPIVPIKKGHLRITDSKQKWVLEQIAPNKTKITFVSVTTLKDPVPRILNRLISQVIPSSSLKNLKKIATEKYIESSRFIANSGTWTNHR
jgi:hypothetical protein